MEPIHSRIVAGAALGLTLLVGGYVASRLTLGTADLVDVALARKIDPKTAQRQELAKASTYRDSEEFYRTSLADALAAHPVPDPGIDRLREPNVFYDIASPHQPKFIQAHAVMREAGLEIAVKVEEIQLEHKGVRTRGQHTLAVVENIGDKPLAYFLQLRSKNGECKLQATGRYNTMVLSPGQRGEISVCSGSHAVEITQLRVMEITELGAIWVSKVPPLAVGHDNLAARSHDSGPGVPMCAEIPAVDFARRIAAREMRWEDLIDFYSRHDCELFRWWPGYERIIEPLASLPSLPPKSESPE